MKLLYILFQINYYLLKYLLFNSKETQNEERQAMAETGSRRNETKKCKESYCIIPQGTSSLQHRNRARASITDAQSS